MVGASLIMIYFKDVENKIHALDSIEFIDLLPSGLIEITQAEADAIIQAQLVKTPEQLRAKMSPLSRVQFKTVMLKNNLWTQAVTLADTLGIEAQVQLSDGQTFERMNPMLNMMAGKLALADDQVDALFNEAYGY